MEPSLHTATRACRRATEEYVEEIFVKFSEEPGTGLFTFQ
jgi:hypothetical protein